LADLVDWLNLGKTRRFCCWFCHVQLC